MIEESKREKYWRGKNTGRKAGSGKKMGSEGKNSDIKRELDVEGNRRRNKKNGDKKSRKEKRVK